MSFADSLTPRDTEEVKPGLYVQKRGNRYRQVHPMAWDGKLRIKEQLKTIFTFRTFFTIALVLFLAWSYMNDISTYKMWYDEIVEDPISWCNDVFANMQDQNSPTLEWGNLEVINENENTFGLPSNN